MCFVNLQKYVDNASHFQQVKLKTLTAQFSLHLQKYFSCTSTENNAVPLLTTAIPQEGYRKRPMVVILKNEHLLIQSKLLSRLHMNRNINDKYSASNRNTLDLISIASKQGTAKGQPSTLLSKLQMG